MTLDDTVGLPARTSLGRHGRSALSVLLRLGSAGGKFLLLIAMAATMDVAAVGTYGVFAATVLLGLYAVGLDYYTYTTRQLLTEKGPSAGVLIRDQVTLQARSYGVSLLFMPAIFVAGLLPWWVAPWLAAILLGEQVSIELYRLLIARKQPLRAHVLLFLRSGLWCLAWAAAALSFPAVRTLEAVFVAWLLGGVLAVVVGAGWTRDLLVAARRASPRWDRIRANLRTASRFLVATLAFRAILTIDRYALQGFRGASEVGIYTIYIGVASAVILVVESGVVMERFPPLIEAFDRQDRVGFRRQSMRFAALVSVVAVVSTAIVGLSFGPLVDLMDRPVYREHMGSFRILLLSMTVACLALVPHHVLYAMHRDRELMASAIVALAVAVPAHLLLVPPFGIQGAAVATLLAFLTLLAAKGWVLHRSWPGVDG